MKFATAVQPSARKHNAVSATRLARHLCLPALGALLLLPGTASAGPLGVSAKAGTLGFGVEADFALSEKLSVRGQFNSFDYDYTTDEDDIEYDGQLELSSYGVLLDWHPMGGAFRLSLGGYINNNELTGTATGAGEYDIGDETYVVLPGDNLRLSTSIELGENFAPYAGLGWGNSPANDGGFMFSFELGVLLQGSPSVDLNATGTANGGLVDFSTDPTVQAELRKEETNLEDDLKDFELYPVITLGLGYRF